jgi:hypothetical protein
MMHEVDMNYITQNFFNRALGLVVLMISVSAPASDLKVIQYTDVSATSKLVVVNGGTDQGIALGDKLKTSRSALRSETVVDTGVLKVLSVSPNRAIAEIVEDQMPLAMSLFPKFPGVMAGDLVVRYEQEAIQNIAIMPDMTLRYDQIFDDPKARPMTYEVSNDGLDMLKEAAKTFGDRHIPMILVEGHTDKEGPSDENQIESYQRALTIKQILVNDYGFDPERVIAIGLGETENAVDSTRPEQKRYNRRIVIKAKSVDEDLIK